VRANTHTYLHAYTCMHPHPTKKHLVRLCLSQGLAGPLLLQLLAPAPKLLCCCSCCCWHRRCCKRLPLLRLGSVPAWLTTKGVHGPYLPLHPRDRSIHIVNMQIMRNDNTLVVEATAHGGGGGRRPRETPPVEQVMHARTHSRT